MAQFLKEAGLSKYEQNLMNYGVESIEDLCGKTAKKTPVIKQ